MALLPETLFRQEFQVHICVVIWIFPSLTVQPLSPKTRNCFWFPRFLSLNCSPKNFLSSYMLQNVSC